MEMQILQEIVMLLAISVVGVALFRRLKLPPTLAYLFIGLTVGPYGLGWIANSEDTRFLAEFGVVFLLFTVGLEFSLPKLIAMRRAVLGLGGAQVIATTLAIALLAWMMGMPLQAAALIGGTLAMSSTAIVIKQLTEQLELNSRHGRLSIGILLFQDLAVIPFLIVIPALAGINDEPLLQALALAFLKGVTASLIMLSIGHWLLRPLFHEIASAHSAELFTLTVLLFSISAAWLTNLSGLSFALGAFLAGMMLGETEFRHQVEADIRPFRDVLLGLFFITVGMLLNIATLPQIWYWVVLLVAGLIVFKTLTIMAVGMIAGVERGVALRTGLVLSQGGEFGFALLSLGLSSQLLEPQATQIVLAAIILSMLISPWLIRYNGAITKKMLPASYSAKRREIKIDIASDVHDIKDHIVICGYGRIGQNVARLLEQEGFEYVALDLDPLRVREARAAGDKVFYGDSTHREILEAAGLHRARVLVISFDDARATSKILTQLKELKPTLPILVRTRDDTNLERFQQQGATEVVPETLEASLMLVSHLLLLLGVPVSKVIHRVQVVRASRYQLLRQFFHGQEAAALQTSALPREGLRTVILSHDAYAIGKTLGEINLDKTDVLVTAVRRLDGKSRRAHPQLRFRQGDVVIIYGAPENLERAQNILLKG